MINTNHSGEVAAMLPPAPVWTDEASGMSVWVHGGNVEITLPDGWSGRMSAVDAAATAIGLRYAVASATAWAGRWNPTTRSYDGVAA
jgi:hypothetical protein